MTKFKLNAIQNELAQFMNPHNQFHLKYMR